MRHSNIPHNIPGIHCSVLASAAPVTLSLRSAELFQYSLPAVLLFLAEYSHLHIWIGSLHSADRANCQPFPTTPGSFAHGQIFWPLPLPDLPRIQLHLPEIHLRYLSLVDSGFVFASFEQFLLCCQVLLCLFPLTSGFQRLTDLHHIFFGILPQSSCIFWLTAADVPVCEYSSRSSQYIVAFLAGYKTQHN